MKKGFTLIELMVVISIIGVLSTIVVSTTSAARAKARDSKRISEIKQIQLGLELYINTHGTLPVPYDYGRGSSAPGFWDQWWDLSTNTAGAGFMNFLVTDGIFSKVPVDPQNTPAGHNDYPNVPGARYFYFYVQPGYGYQGGSCNLNQATYMIGITDLETIPPGPPYAKGSGCSCLWKDLPNFFQSYFDYIICGQF